MNDARAMGLFLSSLQVPEANICTLINEDATRESILSRFQMHLIRNPQIEKGDVIIFFYAGHGSRVEAPKDWGTSDGKIETICPHDEGTRDKDGKEILGIPSMTVNELFRTLAAEKGNNIVGPLFFFLQNNPKLYRLQSSIRATPVPSRMLPPPNLGRSSSLAALRGAR